MRTPDETYTRFPLPCVYAWYRGDVCLYVGSTQHFDSRLRQHARLLFPKANGFQHGDRILVWRMSLESLPAFELNAIRQLQPTLNQRRDEHATAREKIHKAVSSNEDNPNYTFGNKRLNGATNDERQPVRRVTRLGGRSCGVEALMPSFPGGLNDA